jgi:hypothetical protein
MREHGTSGTDIRFSTGHDVNKLAFLPLFHPSVYAAVDFCKDIDPKNTVQPSFIAVDLMSITFGYSSQLLDTIWTP